MVSARAWFALAFAAVVGLFYVGHGLHSGSDPAWQLPEGNAAMAQEKTGRNLEWHGLTSSGVGSTIVIFRTKVPGGWLMMLSPASSNRSDSGLAFIPDPEHKWDGSSLK